MKQMRLFWRICFLNLILFLSQLAQDDSWGTKRVNTSG
jgi:hypothetical protein